MIVAGVERGWPRPLGLEGIEAIMFRTIGDRPSLWESLLPPEVLGLPVELARVDALLDDPAFFAPFAPYFHAVIGELKHGLGLDHFEGAPTSAGTATSPSQRPSSP